MSVCLCVCPCVRTRAGRGGGHVSAGADWGQKRVLDFVEMELEAVGSSLTLVVGTEHLSLGRAASPAEPSF